MYQKNRTQITNRHKGGQNNSALSSVDSQKLQKELVSSQFIKIQKPLIEQTLNNAKLDELWYLETLNLQNLFSRRTVLSK